VEAGANEACERRSTRQSCSCALLSAVMHSGSGTTSDVSRREPRGPKPAAVGHVSCPAAKLTLRLQVNPPIRRPACRLAAADPEFAICESTMRGSREAVVPAGDRGEANAEPLRNVRGRSLPVNAPPARARPNRVHWRGESASRRSAKAGRRITTMRRASSLPKLAEANSPAIEHAPPCANQVEDERSKPTPRRTRVVERK